MVKVTLESILDEVCAWCPFAFCQDDCGVKGIINTYNTETTTTTIKEAE